ncbi:MAG TPA: VWA domain-containing protein [Bryobacteraceae bacterium]
MAMFAAAGCLMAQAPEMATREMEAPPNFRSKVNLVLVPVVVRDKNGDPIGTLKKEDFDLLDRGKPQVIVKFSIEKAGSRNVEFEPDAPAQEEPGQKPAGSPMVVAERFTVFLFDDLHLTMSDLLQVRIAAEKHIAEGLLPTERIAVFTTSGRNSVELTDDREKIVAAMRGIKPASLVADNRHSCPPMSYYMADQIVNWNNAQALAAAQSDAMACMNLDPTDPASAGIARSMAQSGAQQALPLGDADTRLAIVNLRNVIHMLAGMPGQRNLVFVSPGFFVITDQHTSISEIIDLAIHSRVSINSLDARGLHLVGVLPDITDTSYSPATTAIKTMYDRLDATESTMLLSELSDGSGGALFHNSNDLTGGFKKLTTTPEYTYILGFSPQNLKLDGSLHSISVKIKPPAGKQLTVQARRGYYAPKHLADPAEEARREIQEAVFSREVLRDLPVELHTQYFKGSEYEAKLGVLARVDLTQLRFKKAEGRNLNNLTVVAVLFDKNGNYLKGASKIVEMKLKDETLQNKAHSMITIKTNFDVRIGGYVVRLVVRDSEGQLMAAENGSVVIP